MSLAWVVIGLAIAGAVVGLIVWRRVDRAPDLGVVSHQWIVEHRPGSRDSRH